MSDTYRIMVCKSKGMNYESLYQFVTTETDSITTPLEVKSSGDIDSIIKGVSEEYGYSVSDLIVVNVVDNSCDVRLFDICDEEHDEDSTE